MKNYKITKDNYLGQGFVYSSIETAVIDAVTPDPFMYDGQLERIKAQNDKLIECLGRMLQYMFDKDMINIKDFNFILNSNYDLELKDNE